MLLIKIGSYLLSLFPLLIILLMQQNSSFFINNNCLYEVIAIYVIIILIALLRLLPIFKLEWIPVTVTNLQKRNWEQLIYFMTYIIPFITLDITKMTQLITLFFIITFIWIIYIKTNLYLANPFLALIWFNLYNAWIKNSDGVNCEAVILTKMKYKEILKKESLTWLYIIEDEVIFVTNN